MIAIHRHPKNPILGPRPDIPWEATAAFNWCPVKIGNTIYAVYRAMSAPQKIENATLPLSSIGHAVLDWEYNVIHRDQLIKPNKPWDMYGCEDPRITEFDNKYYVFYTALSGYPYSYKNIKVAVAVLEKNLEIVDRKHLITPFDAKAMTLFPERVQGKVTVIVTVNSDHPPERIGIAQLDTIADLWSPEFWKKWYASIKIYTVDLRRSVDDLIEVGAPPLKTDKGWLLIYSHIQHYYPDYRNARFGIEAVLLDLNNPYRIVGRTSEPLLVAEEPYEKRGQVTDIVFPTGALLDGETVSVFYGAGDSVSCVASLNLKDLLSLLTTEQKTEPQPLERTLA